MKKFLLLTKLQLKGGLGLSDMFRKKGKKTRSRMMVILLSVLMIILFGGLSALYAAMYAASLKPMGLLELLPPLWMTATSVILLITTIGKVKGTLFSFSDYDMVMSMPVSTGAIVASRIFVLYLFDLIFTAIFMLPANIVYGINSGEGAGYYVLSTLLMLFVPFVPILAGSFLGLLVTMFASRFRYSNLVAIALSIGLYVAYMTVMTNPGNSDEVMMDAARTITEKINGAYPLARMYSDAVVHQNLMDTVLFVAVSTAVFVVFCMIVGRNYKKINTMITSTKSRSNYKMKELKTSSRLRSLYKKEVRRYFSSPAYVMNSVVGMLLLTVLSIMLLVTGKEKFGEILKIPGALETLAGYVPLALLFCTMLTCTTSSSISLEGKNLWLMKALPVPAMEVFRAKLMLNLSMTLPFVLVDTILFAIVLQMSPVQFVVCIVLSYTGALFNGLLGLIINLMFPRLDWKSEAEVVKQSLAAFLSIFIGMVLGMIPILGLILLPEVNKEILYLSYSALLLIASLFMCLYLKHGGSRRFYQL